MADTEEALKARAREGRVSVIIPVRNGAETIARAIDSALAQTYARGTEIVVANDGSTDCTAEILSRYGDRITLVTLEPSGVSAARNAAVNVARGEYIAFLDADDEWLPDKLARTVPVLDQHPERVLVYHDAMAVDVTGKVCSNSCTYPLRALGSSLDEMLREDFCILPTCTVMRREVYQRCGGCREELDRHQDSYLFLRAREEGPFCCVPDVLARYHFILTPVREARIMKSTPIYDRFLLERYGKLPSRGNSLMTLGLVHMARGDRALARQRYLMALRYRPFEPKALLRLVWTFLPSRFSYALGAVMPQRLARAMNGPPGGHWNCIAR
jgi:glycosyltransferase involved in cell wall biosynthesis